MYLQKGKSQAVCESTQYIYSIHFVLVGFSRAISVSGEKQRIKQTI